MILTTTDKVDGYVVEKYLGLVCGTDIYLVGGLLGGGLASQEQLFNTAMSTAKENMQKKARALGADAIIGINQSFTAPGGVNNMILALVGTAVKLKEEKMEEEYSDTLPPL